MKHVVLVTAIGTVTATSIVKELKKAGEYYIIGADINRRNEIATSLDVDEFYSFPPVADLEYYLSFVLGFCKEHRVEYYYAVIDKEVVNISKNRCKFARIGTKLCVADYELAEVCHYKNTFNKWVEKHMPQIHIRTYDDLDEAREALFPLFIKPVEGVASAGCRRIASYEELEAGVSPESIGKDIIVQEFIDGQNITVDCIRNKETGQKIQIQRRELLRNSNGCGIAVEIFHDEKLAVICDKLMESLDLNGVVNMEFFDTGNDYRIIEINPRFSAGTIYTCMAGVNTVMNAMYIADRKQCVFGEVEIGAHFAERYEAYRMD